MTNWPVGLSTGCFHQHNILECLEPIRASGFSLIEVCSSPPHLDYHDCAAVRIAAERIADLGMEAFSFHAPFADHIDIASRDAALRGRSVAEVLTAAEAAADMRVHYFVLHPGPEHRSDSASNDRFQRMEHVVESINLVAKRCAELGIVCVLENKLPHLLFGNTSDILWILDGVNSATVGACLDTGHAAIANEMFHLIQKLSGHLKMLHAHDNRGNGDDHLPPGDGTIDWEKLMRALINIRFRGTFILELAGQPDFAATLANARRGRTFLREQARRLAVGALLGAN